MNETSLVNLGTRLYQYLAYQTGKPPNLVLFRYQQALARAAQNGCHCLDEPTRIRLTELS